MTYDLLIRGGLVFDGHGGEPQRQDVAVRDGWIVARAPRLDGADVARVIDADGRWVLPGLLDIHTHVDLEAELAPGLPELVRHGTTTAVMSNCSLGLAFGAQRTSEQDPIVDCFARVENIPKAVLQRVVDRIDWKDTAGYLQHLDEMPLGANVVPMVPHSMLRIEVMGLEQSVSRDPTPAEIARMAGLVDTAMQQGYAGFSTDALPFHYLANDPHRREKIPSQWSPREELRTLTDVVRAWRRVWQATPPKDDPVETARTFGLTSGRLFGETLKVTAVAAIDVRTDRTLLPLGRLLARVLNSRLLRGDFRLQALAAPFKVWADGPITPLFEEVPSLRRLNEPDLEDVDARRAHLDDPAWRAEFRAMWFDGKGPGLAGLRRRLRIEDYAISRDLADMTIDGAQPVPAWDGQTMASVHERLLHWQRTGHGARDEQEAAAFATFPDGPDDAEFLLHLWRQWDLDVRWWTVSANRDPAKLERALFDEHFLPGFNDSGAHLTNMAFYDTNLRGLQLAARHGPAKVARHVARLTRIPARFFGLDVGTLDVGAPADIAVIDPQALATWDPDTTVELTYREVLGHQQMVNRPEGVVTATVVNGEVVWEDGSLQPDVGKRRIGRALRADAPRAAVATRSA